MVLSINIIRQSKKKKNGKADGLALVLESM